MTERPVSVREATPDELPAVMGVLDAAMLETEAGRVRDRMPADVLVAASDGRILGALVLDGVEVEAVAVRPRRRGQGIGAALIEAAAERRGRLVAEFEVDRRPFYESLGFEIERADGGRLRGHRG